MSRSRIIAFVGTVAAVAASTVFATSAASAAPTPSVSSFPECILCWTPRSATDVPVNISAQVGSAVASFSF